MKVKATLICICMLLTFSYILPFGIMTAESPSLGVVINEIMYDPAGSDSQGEWIELYNNGSISQNLTGWVITDSEGADDFFFPQLIFPPDNYIVIYSGSGLNDTDFSDGVGNFYMWKTAAYMENSGDDILLKNQTGDPIDYVAYDFGSFVDPCPGTLNWDDLNRWVNSEGNSISLHPNGRDKDSALDWEESDPTPGYQNAHLYDSPPEITNILHAPQNPTSSESVLVSASVSDDYQLDKVSLIYFVDSGSSITIPMTYDGQNYTADIPAYSHGSEITYFINATDDAGQYSKSQSIVYAHSDFPPEIVINEFLANPESDWNNDTFYDNDDEWIELYNNGDFVVNIGGWKLDDKLGSSGSSNPYTIPQGVFLKSKEFLVFYGNETGVILNDFGNENVSLLDEEDTVIDIYQFSQTSDDTPMGRYPDGSNDWKNFLLPTPGGNNQFPVDSLANLSVIKINEFLPSPKDTYSKEWIELYNSGSQPVRLDGCYLDDIMFGGTKPWQIPLGTTLLPNEVIVFERTFGLNNAGDVVNFVYNDGTTIIDSFSYETSEYDISYARAGDGEDKWVSLSIPSPGTANLPYMEPSTSQRSILITSLFYRSSDETEFLCLYNPSASSVDIGSWRITDGLFSYSGTVLFPPGSNIPSKEHIYIANNAVIFHDIMGFSPDYEFGNSSTSVIRMIGESGPSYAMQHDEARLLDQFGTLIDIVVYGESEYQGVGWMGLPVSDAGKGEILKRNFDNELQRYQDTNSSSDWKHLRQHKPGQSDFDLGSFAYSGELTVFTSPDSSYETIIGEIGGAQSTIFIGLYEFTNWNISNAIIEKLGEGIEVLILMEGSPVGGISEDQKYVLQKIHASGGNIRYIITNSTLGPRYNFLHAKYAVVDNTSLIISSENWKYTGIPVSNDQGNRGWGAVISDPAVALYFAKVFYDDWQSVEYDIMPFTEDDPRYGNASSDFVLDDFIITGDYHPVFSQQTFSGNFTITPVLAPDTALSKSDSVLGMINSASESIYMEQLEVELTWDTDDYEYDNAYLTALITAAEIRHVEVKILLSSMFSYPDNPKLDNYDTMLYINNYAENHNLTDYLSARLFDYNRLGLSKLHNKGIIVDGEKTLISSINWGRNSVTQNREVGVIIESTEVANYFTQVFFWDWNEPPSANAGADITATTTEIVAFNEPSYDSDDNIISYFWDFDDGSNSTLENPSHRFPKEGLYEVTLTVYDGQYIDSSQVTVLVIEAEATEGELGLVIYGALLIIFVVIFFTIITFLRRMRFKFL